MKKDPENDEKKCTEIMKKYDISKNEIPYFFGYGEIKNDAYNPKTDKIWISYRDGSRKDITEASDQLNYGLISKTVVKNFIYHPK